MVQVTIISGLVSSTLSTIKISSIFKDVCYLNPLNATTSFYHNRSFQTDTQPRDKMANILIIDDQEWIKDLCREGLAGEQHNVSTTDNVEDVSEHISSFKPHIILLNQYLKRGFLVWDVLKEIKNHDPKLPVLIVTIHDTHLKSPQLSMADGYVVKSHVAAKELKQKITNLLGPRPEILDASQLSSFV